MKENLYLAHDAWPARLTGFAVSDIILNSADSSAIRTVPVTYDPVKAAPGSGRRIVPLDGLRGVAAIMVLLHHSLLTLPVFANYEWYSTVPAHLSLAKWLLLRTPL